MGVSRVDSDRNRDIIDVARACPIRGGGGLLSTLHPAGGSHDRSDV
jgi:hypothetical protein